MPFGLSFKTFHIIKAVNKDTSITNNRVYNKNIILLKSIRIPEKVGWGTTCIPTIRLRYVQRCDASCSDDNSLSSTVMLNFPSPESNPGRHQHWHRTTRPHRRSFYICNNKEIIFRQPLLHKKKNFFIACSHSNKPIYMNIYTHHQTKWRIFWSII